jgi:CubicO group peptidase (beta-lactamase class C family)
MPRPAAASAREAGLSLRTRDLAKLGELVLQHGRSGTGQVVPAEWIDASRQLAAVGALTATGPLGYGDLWWVGQLQGRTHFRNGRLPVLGPPLRGGVRES